LLEVRKDMLEKGFEIFCEDTGGFNRSRLGC
jgi:hypothetical protein